MYKFIKKLTASVLLGVMTLANLSTIGLYAPAVIAEVISLENQQIATNHANVEFDAYFVVEEEKVHRTENNISGENSIKFLVNVKNTGYLKNGRIEFENANFNVVEDKSDSTIQKVIDNAISLNQINSGSQKIITLPIEFGSETEFNLSKIARDSKAKFTATYIDGTGKAVDIVKEINIGVSWTEDVAEEDSKLEEEITKFVPFNIDGNEGVLIQTSIKTGIVNNKLPVKSLTIETTPPEINNTKPEKVLVYAVSTKGTNGDVDGYEFTSENYEYNQEENKLTIVTENSKENGNISWEKSGEDEYRITYVYGKSVSDFMTGKTVKINLSTKVIIQTYSSNSISLTRTKTSSKNLTNQIGTFIDIKAKTVENQLSKGYLYSNLVSQTKIGTEYNSIITLGIADKEIMKKLNVDINADKVYDDEKELTFNKQYSVIKSFEIDKKMAVKMLGEQGTIDIYNGEIKVTTVNLNEVEGEKVVIDLGDRPLSTATIKTSNILVEGTLAIKVRKEINKELDLTKEQIASIKSIGYKVTYTDTSSDLKINLVEPETEAKLVINKTNWTTVITNQGVEFKAVLKTDSINNRLFKNPIINFNLPVDVKDVKINDVKVLFDTELTIKKYEIITNPDGSKTIKVELDGEQTKYDIEAVTEGANVIVNTDITLDRLGSSKNVNVTMDYTNQNNADATEVKETFKEISIVAPVGLITASTIKNYKDGEQALSTVTGDDLKVLISNCANKRTVEFDMSVINNYSNQIGDVVVLGRIPNREMKDVETNDSLNATFSMELKQAIEVEEPEKVTIYYSTKSNATKDLSDTNNGWTTDIENFENVKSYMIVGKENLQKSNGISYKFYVEMPENLQFNETTFENYIVYYNNIKESGNVSESQKAAKVIITTGEGPVLNVTLDSDHAEDQVVSLGNKIVYTVEVENQGTLPAENVKIEFPVSSYNKVIETIDGEERTSLNNPYVKEIGKLDVGSKVNIKIVTKVDSIDDATGPSDIKEIRTKVKATSDEIIGVYSNEVVNKVKKPVYYINNYSDYINGEFSENSEIDFKIDIQLLYNDITSANTNVTIPLPEGMTYVSGKVTSTNYDTLTTTDLDANINHNKNTNTLTVNVGEITKNISKIVNVKVKTTIMGEKEYRKELPVYAKVSGTDIQEEMSEINKYYIVKAGFNVTQTCNIPNGTTISANDSLTYTIKIENVGEKDENVLFEDVIPKELLPQSCKIITADGERTVSVRDYKYSDEIYIGKHSTVTVIVTVLATIQDTDKVVKNAPTITYGDKTVKANECAHIIEKYVYTNPENPEDPTPGENPGENPGEEPVVGTKRINGLVWKDENKNGIYDSSEEVMSNIEVILIKSSTNDEFGRTITDENGVYSFVNLASDDYMVVFLYDTGKYSATTYKKEGVSEEINSDAIDSQITLEDRLINVAITDKIEITDSNIYNINLGLIDNLKFDLSLEKNISKITIKTEKDTKVFDYTNTKVAKLEFVAKNLEQATTMIVEYTFTVRNEGAIDGYAKKIVDYLPSGMNFSTELNKDWYMGENGTILNSSLSNKKIIAGESEQITLTLTKTVTSQDLGTTINNTAEIFESYNDEGKVDFDSTAGNKASNEDDISSADVILSIKTGKVEMLIGLSLTIIATIGISAYFIKKKVLR